MVDLILIGFIVLYAYIGLKKGFVKSVVNFASTLISLLLTTLLYHPLALLLNNVGLGGIAKNIALSFLDEKSKTGMDALVLDKTAEAASVVIVNIIAFIVLIITIKIGLSVISKSLNIIAKLPIIKQANSLLGLGTGIITGLLISYIIIGVLGALGANETISTINKSIIDSNFAILLHEGNIITDLLTKIIS